MKKEETIKKEPVKKKTTSKKVASTKKTAEVEKEKKKKDTKKTVTSSKKPTTSKKKNTRNGKKRSKHHIPLWMIFVSILLDLGAIFCLVLAYGPDNRFKQFLITTAMSTKSHKYLARMIYDEDTINEVLQENVVIEIDEETNTDAIVIGSYQTKYYENEYEEQILKKEEGNDLYKIFTVKDRGSTYYFTVIYDPSKIHLAQSSAPGVVGETIKKITRDNGGVIGINASGFEDPNYQGDGSRPSGIVIKNGKIVWRGRASSWGNGLIGFNKEHKLVLTKEDATTAIKKGMMDAVMFGPFLIVNGKSSTVNGLAGGRHPRTIIAQRQDGITLFIVIDGNGNKRGFRGGPSFVEVIEVLERYKVYNAANLDGGASSILIENNQIINHPVGYASTGERDHPNAWIVVP